MTDIEQNKSRRLQFLRAVYDLADGTPSHGVAGADVAARLGMGFQGEEFRGLAYFHDKEGNTQNLETNVGRLIITPKGIQEVERSMTPASRQDRRNRLLRAIYDLSGANPNEFVYWRDIAPRLGWDNDNPEHLNEALVIADYLADSELITIEVDDGTIYRITAKGIDEVEGNKPPGAGSTFQFYGPVQGSVIGTHNKAELTNNFDFRAIEQRIEREGGEDKEELKQALAQVERLLERGEYLDRGALARFSDAMERHSWFTGAVMQALIGFATQAAGG